VVCSSLAPRCRWTSCSPRPGYSSRRICKARRGVTAKSHERMCRAAPQPECPESPGGGRQHTCRPFLFSPLVLQIRFWQTAQPTPAPPSPCRIALGDHATEINRQVAWQERLRWPRLAVLSTRGGLVLVLLGRLGIHYCRIRDHRGNRTRITCYFSSALFRRRAFPVGLPSEVTNTNKVNTNARAQKDFIDKLRLDCSAGRKSSAISQERRVHDG
jgi:hypothetical protein